MDSPQLYNFLKIFHILAMVAWMAALFYLPRLFVYHSENFENKDFVRIIKIQEYKLLRAIAWPAMIATIFSGIALLMLQPFLFKSGIWLHIKLSVVILLVIYHLVCGFYLKQFAKDINPASGRFFRFFNEIPTALLVVIVTCVVLQF